MYVWRSEEGIIIGVFAMLQPGYAEEYLSADSAEIMEFYAHG